MKETLKVFSPYQGARLQGFFAVYREVLQEKPLGSSLWRPEFLRISNFMNKESMRTHIRDSIPVGVLVGLLLTLVSVVILTCLFK